MNPNHSNSSNNHNDIGLGPYGSSGGFNGSSGGPVAALQLSQGSPLSSPVQSCTGATQNGTSGDGNNNNGNGTNNKPPALNQDQLRAFFATQWPQIQPQHQHQQQPQRQQQPQHMQQQPQHMQQQAFSPQHMGLNITPAGPPAASAHDPTSMSSQTLNSFPNSASVSNTNMNMGMSQQQQQHQTSFNSNNGATNTNANTNTGANGGGFNEQLLSLLIQQKVQQVLTQMPGTNDTNANGSGNGNSADNPQQSQAMQAAVASALATILQQPGAAPAATYNASTSNQPTQQTQQQMPFANMLQGLMCFGNANANASQSNNNGNTNCSNGNAGADANNNYCSAPAMNFQAPSPAQRPSPAPQQQQQQSNANANAPQDIFSQALQLLGQQPQVMQQQPQQMQQQQQPSNQGQQQQQGQPMPTNNFIQSLLTLFGSNSQNGGSFPPGAAALQQPQPHMQQFQQPQQQMQQQLPFAQMPQQQMNMQQDHAIQPQGAAAGAAPMVPPSSIVIPSNAVPPPHPDLVAPLKRKRGRVSTFPQKLHQMLRDLEADGKTNIASFVYDGRAFMIHDAKAFVEHCIPKYFKMTSLSSFQRQLNLYDFHRIHDGPHQGAYFHRLFIQGHAVLSTKMVRNKIIRKPKPKKKKESKTKKAAECSEDDESDGDEGEEYNDHTSSNGRQKSTKAVSDGSSSPSNSAAKSGAEEI